MEDYPLTQEAKEVQEILDGAVLSNKGVSLSEQEKAQARENIGATALGQGIRIISHFDTLAKLKAAVPDPKAGDAYSIGTALPYNMYGYDFFLGNWRNYGAIRANDIAARFAQNVVVATSAWTQDTTVFADFTWKASIPLAEVTGNDFPIVGFNPAEAGSGNFAALAYAFDGHVEIWAKAKPTSGITIPTITFIVQDTGDTTTGNSTKGITNASVGVGIGGVTTEMIGPLAVGTAQIANAAVTRAKLAQDALYSPMYRPSTTPYTIQLTDIGKTLCPGSSLGSTANIEFIIDDNMANAPDGTEIAIFYRRGASLTIQFSGKQYSACVGHTNWNTNRSYIIPELFGMCAIKKVDYGGGYNYWLISGNVEVVG